MSDFEKQKKLFDDFGIGYEVDHGVDGDDGEEIKILCLQEGEKNIEGYSGMFCNFIFTKDGKFKCVGIWE